jgi:multiple sugar transport system permease protein/raffinose/stachyose/melibiose transport system permease protein
MHRVLGDRRAVVILLGPALLVYSLIMLVPMFWSVGYSFTKGNTIQGFSWNGSVIRRRPMPLRRADSVACFGRR